MTNQIGSAVFEIRTDTSTYKKSLDQIEGQTRKSAGRIRSILDSAIGTSIGFGVAQAAMGGVQKIISLIGGSIVGMNAQLEAAQLRFEVLTGSAEKGAQIIKDLFQFAKRTPFATEPIIEAAFQLQVFGKEALNNIEMLTSIGDAAAGAGRPISRPGGAASKSGSPAAARSAGSNSTPARRRATLS